MNKFTTFWVVYVAAQYRALWLGIVAVFQAAFYRRNSESWNQYLVYDHGFIWRLGRDLILLLTTAIRLVVGLLTFLSLLVGSPICIVLRATFIPLLGLWRGYRLMRALRRTGNAG